MWGKVSDVLSPNNEHPRMKFSTGLIGLALALNVHAAPKPSSSTAAKSTSTKPPATTSASPLPSSSTQQATTTTCRPPSVAQYSQCGGMGYTGSTTCTAGGTCVYVNEWYSQCMYCVSSTSTSTPRSTTPTSTPTSTPTTSSTTTAVSSTTTTCVPPSIMLWSQCGGQGYTGASTCPTGGKCVYVNEWYSQCMYCL